jgi:hypothetical protein
LKCVEGNSNGEIKVIHFPFLGVKSEGFDEELGVLVIKKET